MMRQNLLTLWHGNKFLFFIYRKKKVSHMYLLSDLSWLKIIELKWKCCSEWPESITDFFFRRFKMLLLMLKINCMHTDMCGGERETWGSGIPKQNTACVGLPDISDTYYRYWYYQNRAWENSFQIPGQGAKNPFKTFSPYTGNKGVIITSSLRITKQQKKMASQGLTW